MIVLSVVLLMLLSGTAAAQTNVVFPDPNLEAAIRSVLGKPTDPLSNLDLEVLISLTACNLNITNLSGLEWATNLMCLNLSGNAIDDVTPLRTLNRLFRLIMDRNRLRDISPLVGLTNLNNLSLAENLISDGGGLSGLTNLSGLWLDGNSITNPTFLQNLKQLDSLGLGNNRIASLTPLVTLTNLGFLALGGNPVSDYSTLSTLTHLTSLSVPDGSITNLTVLKDLSRLASLSLYKNPLKDVTPLAGLTNLSYLDLRWNPLTNHDLALVGLTNLTSLYLSGTAISNVIFLQHLVRLAFLNLGDNQISDLSPLVLLTNLSYLVLSGNPISNYTVLSDSTNLVNLELRGNSISNLTFVSSLTRLKYADLAYNSIVDISPLALLTNLDSLDLTGNPIGNHTGLSGVTNLANLWLSGNSISNLTFLQGLSKLRLLILDDNRIVDPSPLATLTNLTGLGLSKNPIINYAALAGFTNVSSLWLAGNSISNLSFLPGLIALKALELRNNRLVDLAGLSGLTNLNAILADYCRLTNITALQNLPRLSHVQLVGNPLEVGAGPTAATIQNLKARGVTVAYLPTNQPPDIWISTNWAIAVNESSSLEFDLSDDVTPYDQLLVTAVSSNPALIPNENLLLGQLELKRTLTVTPAAEQTGTAMVTLTVYDAAGSSTVVSVQIAVLVPQPVSIPDPNLATAIRSSLNKPTGRLSSVEFSALTNLFAVSPNITSLSGLEWATNLATLYLSGNSITNLTVLQNLSQLTSFTLYSNKTANLSQLSSSTNLVYLSLVGNSISNLSFLLNLTRLNVLNLDDNQIADLSPLSGLTNLNIISLRQNRLTNLVALQDLPQLTDVDVRLSLLDVGDNSPTLTIIQTLQANGATVNYLPQRSAPTITVRPTWIIPWNSNSSLSFGVSDEVEFASPLAVTAGSGSPTIIPNESLTVGKAAAADWYLSVTPATNQIGTTTVNLTATNDVGLGTSTTIMVTVTAPLPLDDQLLEGANLIWLTGGNVNWFGQASVAHGGGSAAQSGSIQNSQESWMETTLVGPGILKFWWKVSSELFWDWLEFSLNGLPPPDRISGEVDWQPKTVTVPRGTNVARWRYFKDPAYSGGLDAAWVDQVTFLPLSWLEFVGRPNNSQCELLLHPVLGRLYQIQASTNLSTWFPLAVVTATNAAMPFLDLTANSSARFYRLQELTASSIRLQNPKWITNTFQLELQSPPGLRFEVQASADLLSWSGLSTISNALGTVQYTEMQTTNTPKRFYRALLLP